MIRSYPLSFWSCCFIHVYSQEELLKSVKITDLIQTSLMKRIIYLHQALHDFVWAHSFLVEGYVTWPNGTFPYEFRCLILINPGSLSFHMLVLGEKSRAKLSTLRELTILSVSTKCFTFHFPILWLLQVTKSSNSRLVISQILFEIHKSFLRKWLLQFKDDILYTYDIVCFTIKLALKSTSNINQHHFTTS